MLRQGSLQFYQHPSRDAMFFGQKMPRKIARIGHKHDVFEPLKQALLASRDVMISRQIIGSKLQRVFTLVRVGFWQNGFFAEFFFFLPPDFFADFVAGIFSPHFVGKSAQKNPPGKSPAKSSKFCTAKIPDTFLQRGWANIR